MIYKYLLCGMGKKGDYILQSAETKVNLQLCKFGSYHLVLCARIYSVEGCFI